MPTDLERLTFLGIDPAILDPAPSHPARADWRARIDIHSPDRRRCRSCGALAVATRVVDVVGLGLRWHDQCRDCMIAGIRLNWAAGRPMAGRYRVTLWAGERPMLEGWRSPARVPRSGAFGDTTPVTPPMASPRQSAVGARSLFVGAMARRSP